MKNKFIGGGYPSPRSRFLQARAQATYRNELWNFTFEDWILLWMQNDYWAYKGTGKGQYKMYRLDANMPWQIDNVEIGTRHGRYQPLNQPPVNSRKPINTGAGHAHGRPIMADGTKYHSQWEAAKAVQIHPTAIGHRVRSQYWPGWYFI